MTAARKAGNVVGQPSLPEKVIAIHEALADAKVPHALGGALALAYYADPRATIDIDVNVFVPTERWRDVVDALTEIGVSASRLDPAALKRDGQCRLWWGDNAVDLFFAYDPIHDAMPSNPAGSPSAASRSQSSAQSTSRSARRCSTAARTGSISNRY